MTRYYQPGICNRKSISETAAYVSLGPVGLGKNQIASIIKGLELFKNPCGRNEHIWPPQIGYELNGMLS